MSDIIKRMSKRNRVSVELDDDVAKMMNRATKPKQRGAVSQIVNRALRNALMTEGFALPWSGGREQAEKIFTAK